MRERPILMSAPMVRAILSGRPARGSNAQRKVTFDGQTVAETYRAGFSIQEIADALGCSVQPVKRILREQGVEMRPARARAGALSGAANPAWRGGRHVRSDGCVEVWTAAGRRLEHQVVMERVLGRALKHGEVIHHIDRDKQNNDPANLELTTQSAHAREHAQEMHAARYGR